MKDFDLKTFLEQYNYLENQAEQFISMLKNAELHSTFFSFVDISFHENGITIETEDNWGVGCIETEYVDLPFSKLNNLEGYVQELIQERDEKKRKEKELTRIKEEKQKKEFEKFEYQNYLKLKEKYEHK